MANGAERKRWWRRWRVWLAAAIVLAIGIAATGFAVYRLSLGTFEYDFQPGHCGAVVAWDQTGHRAGLAASTSGKVTLELLPGTYLIGTAGLEPGEPEANDYWAGRPCSPTSNGLGGPDSSSGELVVRGWGQHLTIQDETHRIILQ